MPVWEKSSPAGVKDSGEGGNKCECVGVRVEGENGNVMGL